MKKILSFFIIVLFVLGFSNILVNANEYHPNSDNYIQDEIAEYVSENGRDYVYLTDFIRVDPSRTYSIIIYSEYVELLSIEFYEYDETKSKIGLVETDPYCPNQILFYTSADTKYVMGRFSYYGEVLESIEESFCMYDATDNFISIYDKLDVINSGFVIDYQSIGTNNIGYYYTSVDNPTSPEKIKEAIKVIDNYDGDITDSIRTSIDTYSDNMNIVGTYKMRYEATDSNANTSQLTINIEVKDIVSPVISGSSYFEFEPVDSFSVDDITSALSVSDNYYRSLKMEDARLIEDTLTGNENVIGEYKLTYQIEDGSGNVGEHSVLVSVKDKTCPRINGITTMAINLNETVSNEKIISYLSAKDSYEGDVSDTLKIVSNGLTGNEGTVGEYKIELTAEDSSKNVAHHTITVYVKDSEPPVFYVTDMIINLEAHQKISDQTLISTVIQRYKIDSYETAEVIVNEYNESNQIKGKHLVLVKIDDQEYELVINAVDDLYNEVTNNEKTTFFRRLFDKIMEIIKKIKEFISQWK